MELPVKVVKTVRDQAIYNRLGEKIITNDGCSRNKPTLQLLQP